MENFRSNVKYKEKYIDCLSKSCQFMDNFSNFTNGISSKIIISVKYFQANKKLIIQAWHLYKEDMSGDGRRRVYLSLQSKSDKVAACCGLCHGTAAEGDALVGDRIYSSLKQNKLKLL